MSSAFSGSVFGTSTRCAFGTSTDTSKNGTKNGTSTLRLLNSTESAEQPFECATKPHVLGAFRVSPFHGCPTSRPFMAVPLLALRDQLPVPPPAREPFAIIGRSGTKGEWLWQCSTHHCFCLLYTSPSPRDKGQSRMPSSA